jgi:hypothetical protein
MSNSNNDDTISQRHPLFDSMMVDLFRDPATPAEAAKQLAAIRHALLSVMQDLAVMKQAIQEANVLTKERYKELRVRRMMDDHSEAGPTPWTGHSYYPHLQNQSTFLAESLGCNAAEIADFHQQKQHARTMT